ncbi:MAG: response regulator [Tagaea sp.]|nr:response regulator [Tagaea sp.]
MSDRLRDILPVDPVALVVDDDAFARNLARKLLESLGVATVLTAESGEEALALVGSKAARIDVVLCDLHMPGIDGFEVRRRLRALDPDLPFVMVTGDSRETAIVAARAHEIAAYLVKPISPKQLREKLIGAFARARGAAGWLRGLEGVALKREASAAMQALYDAWARACGAGAMPGREILAEWRLDAPGGFADSLALVEVEPPGPRLRYRHVGAALIAKLGRDPTGKCIDEQPYLHRRHAEPGYLKVVAEKLPHYKRVRAIETLFLLDYRRLLLPFGSQDRVSAVLACFAEGGRDVE